MDLMIRYEVPRALLLRAACVAMLLLLSACIPGGRTQTKIPVHRMQALHNVQSQKLIVILPGRGDDVAALKASGIAEAIQNASPNADVILTGVSLAYYMEGRMPQRLREEVILPAKLAGYKEIWLVGASMGGMGAMMYDREYKDDITGLVLLAPYLGGQKILKQIRQSGGLDAWDAGVVPLAINRNNFDRELWRYIKSWQSGEKSRSDNVWLAYGRNDRLRTAMPPLEKILDPGHVLVRDGGHAWTVWTPAAREIFAAIQKEHVAESKTE